MTSFKPLLNLTNTRLSVIFIVFLGSLILNSCSSLQPKNNDYRINKITDINNEIFWKMNGRMSLRFADGSSEKINMLWTQSGKRLTLEFSGTFGLGSHVIKVKSDGSATITSSKLNESADSLTALWDQFSPIPLPIEAFSYWIKGLTHPFIMPLNSKETNDPKSKQFTQLDWQIKMSRYELRKTYQMPNKIKFSNGIESASVFIDNWIFY
ncbi:MAG: outer membrane lipoprotein LolB [Saccharospirillaceae bacterium]|nr:outer membrane lipoprotein LolB [Pseudomonadales bacterium]NRB80895.1 outer membrane lipoprotein LolB [Saccharospirillaceae bacterium]